MIEIWPLQISIPLFIAMAVIIALVGTRLARGVDRLADRTGLGEAFMGAVFLGACTSLPGITASVTAAAENYPTLALANAFGGIAAQTAFLAIADMVHPRVNLEHAAADVTNMIQGSLLIVLLSILMVGMVGPQVSFLGIHPVTPILLITYIFGMRLVLRSHTEPMWRPRMTRETWQDVPEETPAGESLKKLWTGFFLSAFLIIVAGWVLTHCAVSIASQTGLSESLVGGLMLAVTTSLPELVTSIAAVRQGALSLAVGGILGGNAFDTLFAAVADTVYRKGSIYHAATSREITLVALTLVMVGVLVMGLLQREKRGIANIGFESFLVLAIYILAMVMLRGSG